MKKSFVLVVVLCLFFTIFAGVALANTDYYTFNSTNYFDGVSIVSVTPPAGKTLKLHLYIENEAGLYVWVSTSISGPWTQVAYWHGSGHHYTDLVSNTNGGTYYIRFLGAATHAYGGIYTEP